MTIMRNIVLVLALSFTLGMLTACGGGGGGGDPVTTTPASYTDEQVKAKVDTALNDAHLSLNVIENVLIDFFADPRNIPSTTRDLVTNKKGNISDLIIAKVVSIDMTNANVDELTKALAAIGKNHPARQDALSDTKLKALGIVDFPKWKKDALVTLYEISRADAVLTAGGAVVPQLKTVLGDYYASPALQDSASLLAKSTLDAANLK